MAKILLVEDDKSLREIYGVRLMAEGYEIVSAGDGEEALATAIKERPDLIISDVMMPKISGFDMLDILRGTEETRNIKVIMMTALSSEDQRARGESLGADRYLVKSQVGIEDVVRTVHEVLGDGPQDAQATSPFAGNQPTAAAPVAPATQPAAPAAPAANPAPQQAVPAAAPAVASESATPPVAPVQSSSLPPAQTVTPAPAPIVNAPAQQPVAPSPTAPPAPVQPTPAPAPQPAAPAVPPAQTPPAPATPAVQPTSTQPAPAPAAPDIASQIAQELGQA